VNAETKKQAPAGPKQKPAKKRAAMGPKTLGGSQKARQSALVILKTLAGTLGPTEASEALGVSLTRYYLLETRGLSGLIQALEPRPRGRAQRPEQRIDVLETERDRLREDLRRHQALLRAATRSLGLRGVSGSSKKLGKKKTSRRRGVARGRKVMATLAKAPPETEA
jgi:hypothetical protein